MTAENLNLAENILFAIAAVPFLIAFCSIFRAFYYSYFVHKSLKFKAKQFLPFFVTPYLYTRKLNTEEKIDLKKITKAWLAVIIGLIACFIATYIGIEILKILDQRVI